MNEDFDEDTLETLSDEVIGPIAEMRKKKAVQDNTFVISRENFEKSSNEQIEAWFTKFDQVIIDDSKEPYKDPLTKKELAVKIGKALYNNLNKTNMQKGIGMISKASNMISEFGQAFDTGNKSKLEFGSNKQKTDTSFLTKHKAQKYKRNSLKIGSEDKAIKPKRRRKKKVKVKKEYNPLESRTKTTFFSGKKVKFF